MPARTKAKETDGRTGDGRANTEGGGRQGGREAGRQGGREAGRQGGREGAILPRQAEFMPILCYIHPTPILCSTRWTC